MSVLLLLFACAARQLAPADAPAPVYIAVSADLPMICIASVPDAGRLPDAEAWSRATAALDARDFTGADAALTAAGEHPAVDASRAVMAVLKDDVEGARGDLRDLANTWREDACLQQAAAFVNLRAGATPTGAAFAADARRLAPTEPEVMLIDGMARRLMGDFEASTDTWRAVLALDPTHPQASALLAGDYLGQGDALLALPLLENAMAGGIDVSGLLAPAYFHSGKMADYLRVTSAAKWPLGDNGAIAEAEDPTAVFRALLGVEPGQSLYTTITTSMGSLRCELYWTRTPVTVANFVGLAKGTQSWTDPRTLEPGEGSMYEGTILHRVIPGFMIQMGDPTGTGSGTPGYRFPDEFAPDLRFDRPGTMGMANNGPNANGSQFFITEVATSHLNGRHTVFGQCDEASMVVARAIAQVPRDGMDKPREDIVLESITFSAE